MAELLTDTGVQPLILELLSRRNWFDAQRLEEIEQTLQKAKPGTLSEVTLIRAGFISEQEIASVYAEDLFLPVVNSTVEACPVEKELGGLLPEKLCVDRLICPLAVRDTVLDVAFVSPEEMGVVDELQLMTGLRINPLIAPLSVVESRLDVLYRSTRDTKAIGEGTEDFAGVEEDRDNDNENILDLDLVPPADANGRIVRMVNQILEQALRNRASDIHLEPFEDSCKFRLRIDGVLHELPPPSKSIFIMIVSRLKVLAKMDIAEKRIPQDGAIALRTGDKRIDLRVNTVPTVYGEKMVMRILDKGAIPLDLTGLGLDERQSKDLIESIQSPYGLALVTGPDRKRQVDHALLVPQPVERAQGQYLHGRRPGRVQVQGDEPGSGQGSGRAHVLVGPAGFPAARSRHHHGRRGSRPGDGRDLSARRADGPLRALDDPHQRRAFSRDPSSGHGYRAVPLVVRAAGARGSAAGPPALPELQRAL